MRALFRKARAFTLVEMLIAMFVTSLICVVLWQLVGSGTRAAAYGTWYSGRVAELRTSLRMIREDMAKASYPSVIQPLRIQVTETDVNFHVGRRDGTTTLPGALDLLSFHICKPDRTAMPENVAPADILAKLTASGTTLHYSRVRQSGTVTAEEEFNKDIIRDVKEVKIQLTPAVPLDPDGSAAKGDSTGVLTITVKCVYPFDPQKTCVETTTCKLNIRYKAI